MPFPTSLPAAQLELLAGAFLPGHTPHTAHELAEAAYDVLGYALERVLPAGHPSPILTKLTAATITDAEKAEILLSAIPGHDAHVKVGGAVPWALILQLAIQVLQQVLPLVKV